jgi:hypothetical protein
MVTDFCYTLEQHLTNPKHKKDIYDRCGVYKMKCIDCGGAYISQTGRNLRVRYKEHIRDIRNNKTNTGYANHILNAGHTALWKTHSKSYTYKTKVHI